MTLLREAWFHAVALAHFPIQWTFFPMTWKGAENVPTQGPAVLCANHSSFLDLAAIGIPIYWDRGSRLPRFMTLEPYFRGPTGWYVRQFRSFPVSQNGGRLDSFRTALRILESGELLAIFPEGSRSRDGRLQRFRPGAARIASEAGVPIIPVTINGTYEIWPRHRAWPIPGPGEVVIHSPVPTSRTRRRDEDYLEEVTAKVRRAVASARRDLDPCFPETI